jgi:hypothetical protein
MKLKKETVAKLVAYKIGYENEVAESIADDLMRSDFPLNHIKTMGEALAYIDFVLAESRV